MTATGEAAQMIGMAQALDIKNEHIEALEKIVLGFYTGLDFVRVLYGREPEAVMPEFWEDQHLDAMDKAMVAEIVERAKGA